MDEIVSSSSNVLLFGNGLLRSYGGDSWDALLKQITVAKGLPENLDCPMPLQAVLRSENHLDVKLKAYADTARGGVQNDTLRSLLEKLLSAGFDDILTTNYSYELESTALGVEKISESALRRLQNHTPEVKCAEGKYMLHTWQQADFADVKNRVWHIHGEARKPDSMILGHYYYGSLLYKLQDYLNQNGGRYHLNEKSGKPVHLHSWLDAFILGNVHVLGFGFNFSEFDLWWLLNRKKREKAENGEVYFYRPDSAGFDEVAVLMNTMGVHVESLGVEIPENASREENDRIYQEFYTAAVQQICSSVRKKIADM